MTDEKTSTPMTNSKGAGMAVGIALGVALGAALDNLAVGLAIGVALGAAFMSSAGPDQDVDTAEKDSIQ